MSIKQLFGNACTINAVTTLTLSGTTPDGGPYGLALDAAGNLWLGIGSGTTNVIPANSGTLFGTSVTAATWSTAGSSAPSSPTGIAVDAAGHIYALVLNGGTGNTDLWGLSASSGSLFGTSVTANTWTLLVSGIIGGSGTGAVFDAAGNLYYTNISGSGLFVVPAASGTLFGQSVTANTSFELTSADHAAYCPAVDPAGNVYFIDSSNFDIYVLPKASSTLFGVSVTANTVKQMFTALGSGALGICFDKNGNLFYTQQNTTVDTTADIGVVPVASGTLFGVSVTANTKTVLFSEAVSIGGGGVAPLAFDSGGDLFTAGESFSPPFPTSVYAVPAAASATTDVPHILPGPAWLDNFKPGWPRPRPPVPPSFVNMVTTSGSMAVAPVTYLGAQVVQVTGDVPSINPGPAWLDYFKPGWPKRNRISSPPSGPYYGNQPNLTDQNQIRPGPTWLDTFKPGMPRPRPQTLPTGTGQLSGLMALAAPAMSGTVTVYPTCSGGLHQPGPAIQAQGATPLFIAGSMVVAPVAIQGQGKAPVITSGSMSVAAPKVLTPPVNRDMPQIQPGPAWLQRFKPMLPRRFKIPANPGFVITRGSMAVPPPAYESSLIQYLPFPQFPLSLKFEILVNGTWLDVSDYVYQRDNIVITRGLPDETQAATPSQVTLTLNNRDGRFSPNNPSGAYYPYLTRNTQLRCSVVNQASAAGVPYSGFRFWGEVSAWPPRWDPTQSDIYCQVVVSGPFRRFVQGAALGSTLYQYYSNLTGAWTPYAYWPCQDGGSASEIASALPGVAPMGFTGTPGFSSNTGFGGSDALPVISGSTWHGVTAAAADPPGSGSITEIFPGTYVFTCPPGVTQVTGVTCIGAGGGGGDQNSTIGGGAGGGGGTGKAASVAVTPGQQYTYVVPPGGGTTSGASGSPGGNATFTGDTQTVTGFGGIGGNFGGSGGQGGLGSTYNGGTGGSGTAADSGSNTATYSQSLNGNAGASGTGKAGGQQSVQWTAPDGITGAQCSAAGAGGGGGGGGQGGSAIGGGGGGGGAFASSSLNVSPGETITFLAGNGGGGGAANGGAAGTGGASGTSDGQVTAGGGVGGTLHGGGAGQPSPSGTPGSVGGEPGNPSGSNDGGGGGGGGSGQDTGHGGNASGRTPGAPGGNGGGGGWGAASGNNNTAGGTGGSGNPDWGGGGGGGGARGNGLGAVGGGGGAGSVSWSWTVDNSFSSDAQGGGGGSSAGTSTGGNDGGTATGGSAPSGGGAGGSTGSSPAGASPGGGGAGGVPQGQSTNASPPGAGAAGSVSFSWSGGVTSPVAADIVRFCLECDSAGSVDGAVLLSILTYGTIATVDLVYHTGGVLELIGYNSSSTVVFDSGAIGGFAANGKPLYMDIELTANGSSVEWLFQGIVPGAASVIASASGSVAGTVGNVSDIYVDPAGTVTDSGTSIGQITVQTYADTLVNLSAVAAGYTGETAAARMARLCAAQGLGFTLIGSDTTPQMGPQQDDTWMNVMQSCCDLDRGQLYETRGAFGVGYRTRTSMQGQNPALLADYSAGVLAGSLEPTADDQQTRNDITVTRNGGASSRAFLAVGTMSVQSPPNGVGDYTYSLTVQAYADSQLANLVAWMLTIGTVSEYRYPTIEFDMSRVEVEELFTIIPDMDIGDYLQVYNPPSFLQVLPVNQLFWGVTETLNAYTWTININTVPESPYAEGNPPTW